MRTAQVLLESADPNGGDAARLLREMTAEVRGRYSDVLDVSGPPPVNDPLVPRSEFLIARLDGEAVGCAAIRPLDAETAEVRRMFVTTASRRRGIARCLLAELERLAAGFGYRALRLETGNRQPEAMALYSADGYYQIEPYGPYIGDPLSVCFEKILTSGDSSQSS